MPTLIKVKIDLAKIHGAKVVKKDKHIWLNLDNCQLFEGKNGALYLDAALFPTPDSKYGDDYRITQDLPRALREKGERGPILGNAKNKVFGAPSGTESATSDASPSASPAPGNSDINDEDVPF